MVFDIIGCIWVEHHEKVLLINFYAYSNFFENLNLNKCIRLVSNKVLKRFFTSLKVKKQIQKGRFHSIFKFLNIKFIEGWESRLGNYEIVEKHADIIRNIFCFNKQITNPIDEIFSSLEDTIIIGIHIRRGDYKTWREGIYFYSDENYVSLMNQLKQQLSIITDRNIKFLLCSNEHINLLNFAKLDCFIIPETSGEKDLYALSKCSYIIGPPSTYSQWASFMGKVPMKFVMFPSEKIKLSDLSVVLSLDRFDNNKEFSF